MGKFFLTWFVGFSFWLMFTINVSTVHAGLTYLAIVGLTFLVSYNVTWDHFWMEK